MKFAFISDGTQMGLDEFRPRHPLPANRRGIDAVLPQNALDRAASNCVAEVLQCPFHMRVSPALVFMDHFEDQLDELSGFPGSPGSTLFAPIVLFRHLLPIPSQDRVGGSERGHLGQQLAPQFLAKNCEASSIGCS